MEWNHVKNFPRSDGLRAIKLEQTWIKEMDSVQRPTTKPPVKIMPKGQRFYRIGVGFLAEVLQVFIDFDEFDADHLQLF